MRLSLAAAAALLCLPALPAAVQAQAPAAPPPAATPPSATPPVARPDPVVAKVNGTEIHLSDVSEAAQGLPEEVRSMPPQVLFPMLLDQMVDRQALVLEARKEQLDQDPQVQRAASRATDQVLQNALLSREIGPTVTEAALRAKYDADIANKPGETEVHASHILVETEDAAKAIIAQLGGGADFATLAKTQSKDPAAQNGGDLGFFKQGDMVPEFATAAFALKPGDYTRVPIHTQFGWHVIKSDGQRVAPPPPFDQAKDEIRQGIIQAGVRKALDQARTGLAIEKFNMDGTPMTAAAVTPNPTSTPTTDLPPTPGTTPAVPR